MELQIILIVGIVAAITILYKLMPYRNAGTKKPFFALLPKYKKVIKHSLNDDQINSILSDLGFKRTDHTEIKSQFTRGSVIGDISIKLAKVNVSLTKVNNDEQEITVEAGWVAAFDTGDHWKFITELAGKIENA